MKGEPVKIDDPPVDAVYQFNVPPAQPDAFNITVPVPHLELSVPVGADGLGFIVNVPDPEPVQPVVVFVTTTE